MASGLTKARCVRKKKSEGKKLSTARRLCKVKGTYKGERRRTGKRAYEVYGRKREQLEYPAKYKRRMI